MSGFDKDWLSLREPADRAARDQSLVATLAERLAREGKPAHILDIGCGTGSTFRSLSDVMPDDTRWHLLDYDQALLDEARRRIPQDRPVALSQHDLNDLDGLPLEAVTAVTASALFDLCSQAFCARFVQRLKGEGAGLYAALNYNGIMRWSVAHPHDAQVVADFNLHQKSDKGFGPALGPDCTAALTTALEEAGYAVQVADSTWKMGPDQADLQRAFIEGLRQPLFEIGSLERSEIENWIAFRFSAIAEAGSLCEVGHTDILAFPG